MKSPASLAVRGALLVFFGWWGTVFSASCGAEPLSQAFIPTGIVTDLAIDGRGWFVIRDEPSGAQYVTRRGEFRVDTDGYVITWDGLHLQGYCDDSRTRVGPLRILKSDGSILSFTFHADGTIWVKLSDGREVFSGQILLQDFERPEHLKRLGRKVYGLTAAAGPSDLAPPAQGPLGPIRTGVLDGTQEAARLSIEPPAEASGPLTQGSLTWSGIPTDLAIAGPGFFLVRDPVTGVLRATRCGLFVRDGDGYLVTYRGLRVQGFTDSSGQEKGDVRIDDTGRPASSASHAVLSSFSFDAAGRVRVLLSDGTRFLRGRIQVVTFRNPKSLVAEPESLFGNTLSAEPVLLDLSGPYDDGIRAGMVELVNVSRDLLALRREMYFSVQGSLHRTGRPTDLCLAGQGFFLLREPKTNARYVTRNGYFHLDSSAYLVNAAGYRVQGFTDPGLSVRGDIRIDELQGVESTADTAHAGFFYVDTDGTIQVESNGSRSVRGQILLQKFREPFQLRRIEDGLLTNLGAAHPDLLTSVPGESGNASVISGALEVAPDAEEWVLPSRSTVRLRITGEPGSVWTIQASSHLGGWFAIGVVEAATDTVEFCPPEAALGPARFYRVIVAPH